MYKPSRVVRTFIERPLSTFQSFKEGELTNRELVNRRQNFTLPVDRLCVCVASVNCVDFSAGRDKNKNV